MMFSNKLVACLKSNGKVLREFKDTIYIPFGSEYQIYLKNLNSVRAEVNITVDGQSVCDDGLVINANSELNIERFVKDLNKGNRFKFVERSGKIEKNRGIKAEDGLIRIAFKFEKVIPKPVWVWPTYVYPVYQPGHWEWKPNYQPWCGGVTYRGDTALTSAVGQATTTTSGTVGAAFNASATGSLQSGDSLPQNGTLRSASVNTASIQNAAAANDVGITVPGSVSNQQFQTVSSFATEDEEHVMVLRLLGETESGKTVKAPVTVKAKAKCTTCGRNNKATSHYCVDCGTSLEIV